MVHNKIAYYRDKFNITQDELAMQLKATKQYVSKLERENCFPGIKVCFKALKALIDITDQRSNGEQIASIRLDDLFYDDEFFY